MSTRHPARSNDEWLNLITECRQSGMPESVWCDQHDIPQSSYYNAVSRLRKLACTLPDPVDRSKVAMDFTARQEVVRVDIVSDPDSVPAKPFLSDPALQEEPEYLDNSHKIEIILGRSVSIRVSNGADPGLLESAIRSLEEVLC